MRIRVERAPGARCTPILSFLLIGGGFWLPSVALRVLYHDQRSHRRAIAGPYARIRHPQYAGFVLIMSGVLVQRPTLVTLAMFPVLLFMYVGLARHEEAEAERDFGAAWHDYAARTPRFVPNILGHRERASA